MVDASSFWFANPGGVSNFYNGVATQSLRFDDGRNTELTRSPAGATDQKKYTLSCWVKRANLGSTQTIFSAGNSGTGNPGFEQLNFTSGDALRYYRQIGSVGNTEYVTTQVFRDTSAWYNIVVMMDAANTIGYIYVNGVRVTSFSTTNHPTNVDGAVNSTQKHAFGNRSIDGSADFDGYLAEVNFLDGLIVGETSGYLDQFGEVKNGVWIPKEYSGSYGTNGYRLDFADNAHDAPASEGTEDSDNIGSDSSGEHNNWTASDSIDTEDCAMPDSPENNFATMNPLNARRNGYTLTEGNLKSTPSMAYSLTISTFANKSGLFYFEVLCLLKPSSSNNMAVGFDTLPALSTTQYIEKGVWDAGGVIAAGDGSSFSSNVGGYTTGDILSVAYNLDTGKGWFRKNDGDWVNSGNPENDSGNIFTFTSGLYYTPTFMGYNTQSGTLWVANYGQDSSFAGNKTSGSANAQDINGIGDFYYAPPSGGFLALCTANLPEPTIGANSGDNEQADDYFNTHIYDGNNNATRTFDIGFVSDWSWFKARNQDGYGHQLFDSSRGPTKLIFSNDPALETTSAEGVTSFDSSGNLAIGTDAFINEAGTTMVIWNWKANGGTTVTNTAGSINSTVQANTKAGFSIVTYTGNADASATIGHGLGVVPKMIMVKQRDESGLWIVFTEATGKDKKLNLNATTASADSALFNNADPTNQVFSVKDTSTEDTFGEGHTYVAYCFASVEGYSSVGSFKGNASADGVYVYTGFRPAYILMKNTTATTPWYILDNKTGNAGGNVTTNKFLQAHVPDDEDSPTGVDFLSNGFKIRTTGQGQNGSNELIIYMAFADSVGAFKYANAK